MKIAQSLNHHGERSIFIPIIKTIIIIVIGYSAILKSLQLISFMQYASSKPPDGYYDKRFETVAEIFRKNFEDGLEREGAHLSVIYNGHVAVNLWGGYSDRQSHRKWREHTKTILFSTTKAIVSLCLAIQVDRGYLSYDDLVIKYWPEYGQNGKGATTVEDILSHKAGIPYLENITLEDAANSRFIARKLEEAKPMWSPGAASGYHTITFGWLVNEIFRRIDPHGRDLRSFLSQEISKKYGIDLSIGIPKRKFSSVARVTQPGLLDYARDLLADPRMVPMLMLMYAQPADSIAGKAFENSNWLPLTMNTVAMNNPEIAEMNIPAVTGIGDAYQLAKLFSLAIDGTLISNRTLALVAEPTLKSWYLDKVLLYPTMKGHGFLFDDHPTEKGKYLFGHPGYGCQSLQVDFDNKLVLAYVTNGLKTGSSVLCRTYQRIFSAVYEVVKSSK